MKSLLLLFFFVTVLAGINNVRGDDAELLRGKWLAKKNNEQGQGYTQTIEVRKDKFVFQILDGDNNVVLHAEGALKLDKLGPFNSARFFDIRGGGSPTELSEVNEEYNIVYMLDGDAWTVASNFDKERDQKPVADVYHRVKESSQSRTLVIDAIEMAETPQNATWFLCFEANVEGVKARHFLPDKGYEKNQATIPLTLNLPKVKVGQKCSFKLQLDDVEEDTCSDEVDNRSTGEFTVSEQGSQIYKPEANWRYTIRWHLK